MTETGSSMRTRIYRLLEPSARLTVGLSPLNVGLILLILLATFLAVLETEPTITARHGSWFAICEAALGVSFAAEYVARFWVAPEKDVRQPGWKMRLKFIFSPAAIADLAAILVSFLVVGGTSAMLLRVLRLGRILRIAKLGRMSRALDHLTVAVRSRKDELILSLAAGLVLMLVSATLLYFAEGGVQPDEFGSIPRALWWAMATTTTIGYGDAYPVTVTGKLLASLSAIVGIGVIAMPTGILAAAFSDAMQRHKEGR